MKAYISSLLTDTETGKEIINNTFSDQDTFSYWPENSEEYKHIPLPKDLDTSSMVFCAAIEHIPKKISIKQINSFIEKLLNNREHPSKLFSTWLINHKDWKDVDIVVNSNIIIFLDKLGIEDKKTIESIEKQIVKGQYSSKYYHDHLFNIYCISQIKGLNNTTKNKLKMDAEALVNNKSTWHQLLLCAIKFNLGDNNQIDQLINISHSIMQIPVAYTYSPHIFIETKTQTNTTYANHPAIPMAIIFNILSKTIKRDWVETNVTETNRILYKMFKSSCQKLKKLLTSSFKEKVENTDIVRQFSQICMKKKPKLIAQTIIDWWYGLVFDEVFDENKTKYIPMIEWMLWYRIRHFGDINRQKMRTRSGSLMYEKDSKIKSLGFIGSSSEPFLSNFPENTEFWRIYLKARQFFDDIKDREIDITQEKTAYDLCQKAIDYSKDNMESNLALRLCARATFAKLTN